MTLSYSTPEEITSSFLIDLVDDWASGPPAEYLVFTPFKYFLNFQLREYQAVPQRKRQKPDRQPNDLRDNAYIIIREPSAAVNRVHTDR